MFAVTVIALLFIYSRLVDSCVIQNRTDFLYEQKLLKKALLEGYDPKIPAVSTIANSSDGVSIPMFEITVALGFLKLMRLAEAEQKVDFIFEYQLEWDDERLSWEPSEYCGIDRIYLARDEVWIPEVIVTEAQSSQDFREDYTKFVRLSHTGHMVFFVPTVTSTLCSIKVRDFPFDSQECSIKMISHSFATTVYGINMVIPETLYSASPLDSMVLLDRYHIPQLLSNQYRSESMMYEIKNVFFLMGNGEWHMKAVAVGSKRIEFDDAAPVIVGSFDFSLERNPAFYVAIVITPSFVINIICILGLFLSGGNVMSKLGMALTNIMSLTFILGILASVLPKTDQLPKIGVYVVVNLALITGSLIIVLLLPYLPLPFGLSIREKEEKEKGEESDNPKTNRYVNIALLILLQLANLTNVLVLVL